MVEVGVFKYLYIYVLGGAGSQVVRAMMSEVKGGPVRCQRNTTHFPQSTQLSRKGHLTP